MRKRKIIANRLKELMALKERKEGQRITARLVARKTGIAKGTVDRYVRNEVSRFDEHVLVALCDYLNCGLEDLLIFDWVDEDPEFKTPQLHLA